MSTVYHVLAADSVRRDRGDEGESMPPDMPRITERNPFLRT